MQAPPSKLTPEMKRNPYPFYASLREAAPVQEVPALMGCQVISRHEHIGPVLKNTAVFSSTIMAAGGLFPEEMGEEVLRYFRSENSLIASDPPLHTRIRALVSRAFTPRRIADLEPRIREIASGLIDALLPREDFDFVSALAEPLPVIVISEMLGIEPERRRDFKRWSDNVIKTAALGLGTPDLKSIAANLREFSEYMEAAIERRRREPGDDLISALVQASEGLLDPEDVTSFTRLLLVAGNETTTNLLGNGMVALLRNPSEWERLVQDASLVPNAVEEMLRYDSPAQAILRVTTQDTEVAGHPLPRGSRVMLLLGAANRDPRRYPDPDRFDVTRDTQGHVAFGHGVHFCLGAPLARLEVKVVLEELLRRVRRLSFAPGQEDTIDWGGNFILRGPRKLRLRAERR
jgi:cytochrome P450